MRERDERARIASPGIGYDKADVEVVGRLPDRAQGPYACLSICFMAPSFWTEQYNGTLAANWTA
jgi:hypothetical protein